MSKNWMRHFELLLTDSKGQLTDFGKFKVHFDITWVKSSTNTAVGTFKIYNLAPETVKMICKKEFTRIQVIAGYDGMAAQVVDASLVGIARTVNGQSDGRNYGQIFSGEIRYTIEGKDEDKSVDSYVLIQAADTDLAFSTTVTSQTLAAGYRTTDFDTLLMKDFQLKGAEVGRTPTMPDTVFPRGRVLFGMTRHLMDNVAAQCEATWMFVNGKREMVAKNEVVHDAIVLNSETGLIGMPQQTFGNGVNVTCLINPNIHVNGLIELNQKNAFIKRKQLSNEDLGKDGSHITTETRNGNITVSGTTEKPASIATDGVYVVQGITYSGDTRGKEWYMVLTCVARGA